MLKTTIQNNNFEVINMPNIAKILKDEIQRLAKKEVSQAITPLKKQNTQLRKEISQHKRRLAALEKENKNLSGKLTASAKIQPQISPDTEQPSLRLTAKILKTQRSRLGITQEEFAKIIGASVQAVRLWETKPGRINMRSGAVVSAIAGLKSMNKADMQKRIGKTAPVQKKAPRRKAAPSQVSTEMIIDLRNKFGISQLDLARLVGVSNKVVSVWEKKNGFLTFRNSATEAGLLKVMKMSKKAVITKLKR